MEKVQVHSKSEAELLGVAEEELQTQYMQDPANKSTGDQTTGAAWPQWCDCTLKGAARKAVLIAVLVVIWMLLAIPAWYFYLPQDEMSTSTNVASVLSTCAQTEVYHGDVCREALQDVQSCLMGDQGDGNIYIPASGSQDAIESEAQTLIAALPLLQPSQGCEEAIVPFLCLHMFRLCGMNGSLHQLSSQQCSDVTGNICATEYPAVEAFVGTERLPDCTSLPDHDILSCRNVTDDTESNTSTTNSNTNLQCSEDFYLDGICRPECSEWEESSSTITDTVDTLILLVVIVGVIAAVVNLAIFCFHYKTMLKFPTSIVFYQNFSIFVFEVLILVGFMDRKTLFCSSRDLISSINNPTDFCTVSGVLVSYIFLQIMIWWFCHCAVVLWSIKFPFHYRSYQDSRTIKFIHGVVVLLGVVVPVSTVVVTLTTGDYILSRFPNLLCLAGNPDARFYSIVLPVIIIIAVGASMLIIVINETLQALRSKNETRIAQAKILIVLVYYIAVALGTLGAYSSLARNGKRFREELVKYFTCEAAGTGEPCDRSGYNEYNIPVLEAFGYFFVGLISVANLVYVLNFRKMRGTCRRWCGHGNASSS